MVDGLSASQIRQCTASLDMLFRPSTSEVERLAAVNAILRLDQQRAFVGKLFETIKAVAPPMVLMERPEFHPTSVWERRVKELESEIRRLKASQAKSLRQDNDKLRGQIKELRSFVERKDELIHDYATRLGVPCSCEACRIGKIRPDKQQKATQQPAPRVLKISGNRLYMGEGILLSLWSDAAPVILVARDKNKAWRYPLRFDEAALKELRGNLPVQEIVDLAMLLKQYGAGEHEAAKTRFNEIKTQWNVLGYHYRDDLISIDAKIDRGGPRRLQCSANITDLVKYLKTEREEDNFNTPTGSGEKGRGKPWTPAELLSLDRHYINLGGSYDRKRGVSFNKTLRLQLADLMQRDYGHTRVWAGRNGEAGTISRGLQILRGNPDRRNPENQNA